MTGKTISPLRQSMIVPGGGISLDGRHPQPFMKED